MLNSLLICDIDGCLGSEDTAPLNMAALSEIAAWNVRAQRAGDLPTITLCSGRPQPYAEAICRMLANVSVPIVCEMGVWLFDPRDNSYAMDPAITSEHLHAIAEAQAWVRKDLAPLGVVMQPGKVASISLWHKHTPTLLAMHERLAQQVQRERWGLRVSSTVAWINLDLAHVSKGTGLDRLFAVLRSEGREPPLSNRMGIGDTLGDMAIRERVAWFGCPSNADPTLKARADCVSTSQHARGVVELLTALKSKLLAP